MKKLLLFVACGLLIFQSCKKYEDGPSFSLRSKASRLEGKWGVEKRILNGAGQIPIADDLDNTWVFASDKKLLLSTRVIKQHHSFGSFHLIKPVYSLKTLLLAVLK